jgi:hypothetical protein
VAASAAWVPALEGLTALQAAAAVGEHVKVRRQRNGSRRVGVVLADKLQRAAHAPARREDSENLGPQPRPRSEHAAVAHDVEAVLGARERDAHAVVDAEEPDGPTRVGAHEREEDDLGFFTLQFVVRQGSGRRGAVIAARTDRLAGSTGASNIRPHLKVVHRRHADVGEAADCAA